MPQLGRIIKNKSQPHQQLQIIAHRRWWYGISLSLLVPAALALAVFRLNLGIDFTGGSTLELRGSAQPTQLEEIFVKARAEGLALDQSQSDSWLVNYRLSTEDQSVQDELEAKLEAVGMTVERYDQVGPSVSRDLARNALLAIGLMSLAVVIYISWAFRSAGGAIAAYRFGLATLLAAFAHDGLLVVGLFAILGQLFNVKVDSYIVTAVLTVIGFSIHDTIVVFDRVRENLADNNSSNQLAKVINDSVNETIVRSVNTSLVIIVVLLALLLFGGQAIRYFVLALLVGMVAGTYSSIFIASPLLISLQNHRRRK